MDALENLPPAVPTWESSLVGQSISGYSSGLCTLLVSEQTVYAAAINTVNKSCVCRHVMYPLETRECVGSRARVSYSTAWLWAAAPWQGPSTGHLAQKANENNPPNTLYICCLAAVTNSSSFRDWPQGGDKQPISVFPAFLQVGVWV